MYLKMLIILLFLLDISGCMKCVISPPSQAVRDEFGCIGITANASIAVPGNQPPRGRSQGALRGARVITEETLSAGRGAVIGCCLLPLTIPGAATYGAINAHPAEEVDRANTNLINALKENELAAMLHESIIIRGNDKTRFHLVPAVTNDEIPEDAATIDHYLKFKIIAQWVLIGNFNPDIELNILVNAEMERGRDNFCLFGRRWHYISKPKKYFAMALSGTKLLRSEFEVAIDKLTEQIISDIFILTEPEVQKDAEGGSVRKLCSLKTERCPTGQTYRNPFEPNKVYNTPW